MISAQRELIEASELRGRDSTLLSAARRKLEYWKVPGYLIDSIQQSKKIIESITLTADASGIVRQRNIAVGDYVQRGEVLFELISLDRLWVQFDAYEDDLSRINVGDRIVFQARAVPGETFRTRVTFIDPLIDPETRTADVRAEVSNSAGNLKPEMFVEGTVLLRGETNEEVIVPRTAVLWTGKRSVVYVQDPEMDIPTYEFREVSLGRAVGDQYVVLDGLERDERVVVNGAFSVDAAAQLNNKASMMNRKVSIKGRSPGSDIPDFTGVSPSAFHSQLKAVTDAYLEIKDALVETDPEKAMLASAGFVASLDEVDMALLSGVPHNFWMEKRNALAAHAGKISESDDIEKQREQFEHLSNALVKTIKAFGITGDTLYVQHCPMAFDNDGADWISNVEEIRNPYFGERMLKCGLVTDTIQE
jgi:Cu(I)/Ag(I) efflux system membrane fusion protein